MAVAGMDIAEMAEDLALSGVLPGSGGVPSTLLAALDTVDVCRARSLFRYGACFPATSPYHGKYDQPRNST